MSKKQERRSEKLYAKNKQKYIQLVKELRRLEDEKLGKDAVRYHLDALNEEVIQETEILGLIMERGEEWKKERIEYLNKNSPDNHRYQCDQRFFTTGELLCLPQQQTWDCGYRNIQVFLSSLLLCSLGSDSKNPNCNLLMKSLIAPNARTLLKVLESQSSLLERNQRSSLSLFAEKSFKSLRSKKRSNQIPVSDEELLTESSILSRLIDIPSIQKLIERSWSLGFNTEEGRKYYDNKIVGKNKWIGPPEFVSLLRSFGLRAVTVEVDLRDRLKQISRGNTDKSKSLPDAAEVLLGIVGKRTGGNIPTPVAPPTSLAEALKPKAVTETEPSKVEIKSPFISTPTEQNRVNLPLIQFCWEYFSDKPLKNILGTKTRQKYLNERREFVTPLFLQNDGHSVTIIGMERIYNLNSKCHETWFLVLDPRCSREEVTSDFENSVRVSAETFDQARYQLAFILEENSDRGIFNSKEISKLKEIEHLAILK